MKYHEAINGPDGKLWKTEVAKEHQRMIDSGVFEPVKLSEVPKGVRIIDTTWAMKKKRSVMGRIMNKIIWVFWGLVFVICGSILMGFGAK